MGTKWGHFVQKTDWIQLTRNGIQRIITAQTIVCRLELYGV